MEKTKLQEYTARVTQANRSELVVIVYELILLGIEEAEQAHEKEQITTYEIELKRVQKLMNELMGGLNYEYPISYDLIQLYQFVNKKIVAALMKRSPETLEEAKRVMKQLFVGFQEMAKEDKSSPVMENTQQLYAGLTYGKGMLNETLMNDYASRGFKA